MAFQAMNHGLKARAVLPPTTKATHNFKADSVRVLGPSQIVGNPAPTVIPAKAGIQTPGTARAPWIPAFAGMTVGLDSVRPGMILSIRATVFTRGIRDAIFADTQGMALFEMTLSVATGEPHARAWDQQ